MPEEQPRVEQPQPDAPRPEGPQPAKDSITDEITRLGRNFSELIKEALQSPQLQEARRELAAGAQTVIEEVNDVIVKARASEVTQEVAQKAAATVEEIKTAPVAQNIKSSLLNALRAVNEELNEIITKLEQERPPAAKAETETPDETAQTE